MRSINWTVRPRAIVCLCLAALAAPSAPPSAGSSSLPDDRKSHPSCRHCGMDRSRFAHSRMLLTYSDGMIVGVCSIHCAALDMAVHLSKPIDTIQVADYQTQQLVDAEAARWVLGGRRPGVMTHRAKWAFANSESANGFLQEYGGEAADFPVTLKAAYQDMYDFVMSRRKRSKAP